MKNEEEFDELLRNKFSNEDAFPFEEDKWARMEEIIILNEQKIKRRRFFFIFFLGFSTALILMIPVVFYISKENKLSSKIELAKENATSKEEALPFKELKIKALKTINDTTIHSKITQNLDSKTTTSTIVEEEKISENLNSNQKSQKVKNQRSKKTHVETINSTTKSNANNADKLTEDKKTNSVINENKQSKTDSVNLASKVNKTDSTNLAKSDSIISVVDVKPEITDSIPEKDVIQDFDKFSFYAVIGAQYNLGFSKNDGSSFSPYIGSKFQYRFSKSWAFTVGLGVYQVGNFNFEKTITEKSYDFGYRNHVTQINQKQLYYLANSIEINKIFDKTSLAFGINPTFLVANRTEVLNYEETSLSKSEITSKNSFRHGFGLNSFDLQLSLGVNRQLSKKISLCLNYHFGLIDIRDNSWTGNQSKEKSQFLRLNLIYKFR